MTSKSLPNSDIYGLTFKLCFMHAAEIKAKLKLGSATDLPWPTNYFDLVISINTLHNLHAYDLEKALKEMKELASLINT